MNEALHKIETLWKGCTRCPLHQGRTQVVFWRGHPHARLAVIGEAPGEQEDREGQPLVGPAADLFEEMCAMVTPVGPEPWTYFMANTVGCRPPGAPKTKPEEWQACRGRLYGMLAAVRPQAALILGGAALEYLTPDGHSITKRRGKWTQIEFEWKRQQIVIPAMPTLHPGFLLRNSKAKNLVVRDIAMAWERAQPGSWLEGDEDNERKAGTVHRGRCRKAYRKAVPH